MRRMERMLGQLQRRTAKTLGALAAPTIHPTHTLTAFLKCATRDSTWRVLQSNWCLRLDRALVRGGWQVSLPWHSQWQWQLLQHPLHPPHPRSTLRSCSPRRDSQRRRSTPLHADEARCLLWQEVAVREPILTSHDLAGSDSDRVREDGPGVHEGVELAVLATRIGRVGEVGEQRANRRPANRASICVSSTQTSVASNPSPMNDSARARVGRSQSG